MNARGFTLSEILIVVVMLSILASIGVPGYRTYVLRAQRADATSGLLALQTAQEKFYLDNNAYTNNVTGAPPAGLGFASTTKAGKYTLAVALGAGGQSFVATATPVSGAGQDDDAKCTAFTINENGIRGSTGTATTEVCWR